MDSAEEARDALAAECLRVGLPLEILMEEMLERATSDRAALRGVGLDVDALLPLLRSLPNGAGREAVIAAAEEVAMPVEGGGDGSDDPPV